MSTLQGLGAVALLHLAMLGAVLALYGIAYIFVLGIKSLSGDQRR